jgi:hypothetical protein
VFHHSDYECLISHQKSSHGCDGVNHSDGAMNHGFLATLEQNRTRQHLNGHRVSAKACIAIQFKVFTAWEVSEPLSDFLPLVGHNCVGIEQS